MIIVGRWGLPSVCRRVQFQAGRGNDIIFTLPARRLYDAGTLLKSLRHEPNRQNPSSSECRSILHHIKINSPSYTHDVAKVPHNRRGMGRYNMGRGWPPHLIYPTLLTTTVWKKVHVKDTQAVTWHQSMFLTSFINDAMTDQQYYYLTKETAMTTMTTTTTRHNTRMRKL